MGAPPKPNPGYALVLNTILGESASILWAIATGAGGSGFGPEGVEAPSEICESGVNQLSTLDSDQARIQNSTTGGGQGPIFDDGRGKAPKSQNSPKIIRVPPFVQIRTSDFGRGPWPPCPPPCIRA